jgi:hypothetical protein
VELESSLQTLISVLLSSLENGLRRKIGEHQICHEASSLLAQSVREIKEHPS